MEKKKESVTKEAIGKESVTKETTAKESVGKATPSTSKARDGKEEVKFIDVPIQVLGEHKQKKYVGMSNIGFTPDRGNIFVHLDDKHILLLKSGFMSRNLKLNLHEASEIEKSIRTAPKFEGVEPIESKARMKILGERDGKVFVGPTGSINYDARYKGLQINLDGQHMAILDGQTLSRELGIKITPRSLEKETLSR